VLKVVFPTQEFVIFMVKVWAPSLFLN